MQNELTTVTTVQSPIVSDLWLQLVTMMKNQFGAKVFEVWLSKLNLVSQSDVEMVLAVGNHFLKNWLEQEYMSDRLVAGKDDQSIEKRPGIKSLAKRLLPTLQTVRLIVQAESSKPNTDQSLATIESLSPYNNIFTFGNELNTAYTFTNFVVTDENRLAHSVLQSIAENRYPYHSSPVFLYGNTGCGKTHLVQAVVWHIKETQPHKKVLYLSSEQFMYQFVKAIQAKQILDFKDRFQAVDLLIIDDLQFLLDKTKTLDEFFYTFNNLLSHNKQIILLCDQEPGILRDIDRKIKSRIDEGIILELKASTAETKLTFLQQKLAQHQIDLALPLQQYIVDNSEDLRAVSGLIKKLLFYKEIYHHAISADDLLSILGKHKINSLEHKTGVTVADIQQQVGLYYHITQQELLSACRNKRFAFPRQVAMFLTKKYTRLSLQDIADAFQKKNHATILHALKIIADKLAVDLTFKEELYALETTLLTSSSC